MRLLEIDAMQIPPVIVRTDVTPTPPAPEVAPVAPAAPVAPVARESVALEPVISRQERRRGERRRRQVSVTEERRHSERRSREGKPSADDDPSRGVHIDIRI